MAMRFMTDRKEIAKAINIDRKPVLRIDISKSIDGYDDSYKGDDVVVLDRTGFDIRCTVKMFGDLANEKLHETPWLYQRICLMPETICITNSFGYSDVMEMYKWNKALRVREGEEVLVLFDAGNTCYLRKMKIGRVTKWVYPAALIIDAE